MDRELVIAALRAHEAELRGFGIAQLYLFGSVARAEAQTGSDVDLFFDTDNPRFSLIELVDVQDCVKTILGIESDVMTRASLHPMLRAKIADPRATWNISKNICPAWLQRWSC